jgi:hypothetical protein
MKGQTNQPMNFKKGKHQQIFDSDEIESACERQGNSLAPVTLDTNNSAPEIDSMCIKRHIICRRRLQTIQLQDAGMAFSWGQQRLRQGEQ